MKTTIHAAALAALLAASGAEPAPDYEHGERSAALVTPQVQAAAAFLGTDLEAMMHALKLQMTRYDMDMRTPEGRRAWHGRLMYEVVDTNALTKTSVYSNEVDGAVWRYREPFRPKPVLSAAKRRTTYTTNGIPARAAATLARRAAQIDGGPVVTNITTTANAPK